MDLESKVILTLLISALTISGFFGKGCNESDNKLKETAISNQCLIVGQNFIDCRNGEKK